MGEQCLSTDSDILLIWFIPLQFTH